MQYLGIVSTMLWQSMAKGHGVAQPGHGCPQERPCGPSQDGGGRQSLSACGAGPERADASSGTSRSPHSTRISRMR